MRALTIPEVAEALRVSVPTVRRLIAGGELPAVQVGRQWRVHPDVLDAWLREADAPAPPVGDLDERMTALAEGFPTLCGAPGVRPWSASKLCDWACSPEPGSGALAAAQFVLSVWDAERDWRCGLFRLTQAVGAWDNKHRAAFRAWAASPWTA